MSLIQVIDTETTGTGEGDQVIELASVSVDADLPAIIDVQSQLFEPTVPVQPEARAVHHITDMELRAQGCPLDLSDPGLDLSDYVAFHYAEFDLRMIAQTWLRPEAPQYRVICTWRCARHIWPDLPSYSNQALRYRLSLQVLPSDLPPHRAMPDALVTAALLVHMLALGYTPEALVTLTNTPVLLSRCPIGDYREQPCADVPLSFWKWLLGKPSEGFDPDLLHTARHWAENPARAPVRLRGPLPFSKYKGTPWDELPSGFLRWLSSEQRDFDADERHTALAILGERGEL